MLKYTKYFFLLIYNLDNFELFVTVPVSLVGLVLKF